MSSNEFDIESTEMELKYKADDIKLSDFVDFANGLSPIKQKDAASWDFYFSGKGLPFEFVRFRNGEQPELTIKIRTNDKNNNQRIEVDLPLASKVTYKIVSLFAGLFGFKENFRIYKYCSIFFYDKIDIVYYTVFNKDMKEIGRFVEIEYRKDVECSSPEEAWAAIKEMESKMSVLGITPQRRLKKALWDMYKNDTD